MRTTVTLDSDVERLLKEDAHARKRSFKVSLNEAVREAFRLRRKRPEKPKPFVVKARPMGFLQGIDYTKINQLSDEMETEAFVALTRRLEKKTKKR